MLLGQLERLNGEAVVTDTDAVRQVTSKILHLIQTQGERAVRLINTNSDFT